MIYARQISRRLLFALGVAAASAFPQTIEAGEMMNPTGDKNLSSLVYVGTYTGKGSEGIYKFRLNRTSATLELEGLAAKIVNPSFLALSPSGRYLVCCNEISDFDGKKQGAGTSFAVDPATGGLKAIGQAPSGGFGPCYVSMTPDEKAILLANYGSGSVALAPFDPATGKLSDPASVAQHQGGSGVVAKRQDAPHAHCFRPGPDGKFAYAVDLGLDQIRAYRLADGSASFDAASPTINKTDPGAGPRHIAFHPGGKLAFSSNELNNTVTVWRMRDNGALEKVESISTVPEGFDGTSYPAEVLVHPSGKYVYVSNRGDNSVVTFSVDAASGHLKTIGFVPTRGDHPRGMSLDLAGEFLLVANQNTDSLVVYRVNPETGLPVFASEYSGIRMPTDFEFLN